MAFYYTIIQTLSFYFRIIFEYSHFYWLSNSYIASYFCIFGNLCIFLLMTIVILYWINGRNAKTKLAFICVYIF